MSHSHMHVIFVKAAVQAPMQIVFNLPMFSLQSQKSFCGHFIMTVYVVYFLCSAPPFACGKSCSFLCHLKLTGKPAFLQTGWGTAYYPFVFRKEFAVKKEGSPAFCVSACLCFSFACIFQPVASFADSSGLRRPEKWALMACFSHATEVCYT